MAGNWIKLRHDIFDDPDVRRLGRLTGLDQDQVVGKVARLWSWADRHGLNGHLDAELEDVDDQVGKIGFGAALVSVGWLETHDSGIVIPNWDRHFSDSAKARGLAGKRMERIRCARSATDPPDPVALGAQPEKTRLDNPPPPPAMATPGEAAATLRAAWAAAAKAGKVQPYRAKAMPKAFDERIAEEGWLDEALRAIEHLPRCRYFDTPATLIQLCGEGFVDRVLAHQFDDPKPSRVAKVRLDDRPPLKVDPTLEASIRATREREARRAEVEHKRLDEMADASEGLTRPRLKLVNSMEARS